MCGIVGYVGKDQAVPVLIQGLQHLEYRGYDSAGVACLDEHRGGFFIVKEKGKLSSLKAALKGLEISSHTGIGHTRWATHGIPSRENAHPHTDFKNQIVLVHNGIIENHAELKIELQSKGFRFYSQTDTEVAANLIGSYYKKGQLLEALRKAVRRLKGFYSFAVIAKDEPGKILAFKRSNPLVIGLGVHANYLASDSSAILPYTRKVLFLEDEEYAVIEKDRVVIFSSRDDRPVKRAAVTLKWNIAQARKDGYPHFMLKEIYEQPTIMQEILSKRIDAKGCVDFDTLSLREKVKFKKIQKVFFVSCGTAYHAGMVGKYLVEEMARVPSEAQVSSEFRYQNRILTKSDMVVLITQSGETADTLAALREAKVNGAFTLAVVNVVGSTIAREADAVIYTHAGPEIGVASTKAYTAQLLTLVLFAQYFAQLKRRPLNAKTFAREVKKIPNAFKQILKQVPQMDRCAKAYYHCPNFLYLGRGVNFATALEGALKLKEISYAHAHGYAAGEMKHGPIALIDDKQPVICISPSSKTYDKMISNIEEIKTRKGVIIAIGTQGDRFLSRVARYFFEIPATLEILTPLLAVLPLQLLAYKIAVLNKRDVDQPRNLAKSVTVE